MAEFSVAVSILKVVDFGTKFAITAYGIYQSNVEVLEGLGSLKAQSNSFDDVLKQLQFEAPRLAAESSEFDNNGMVALAKECSKTLKKMLETLAKVEPPKKARFNEALKSTFKRYWKQGDIETLQTRLNDFRHQVTLNLVFSVRQYAKKTFDQQELALQKLDNLTRNSSNDHAPLSHLQGAEESGFGSTVVQYLTRGLDQGGHGKGSQRLRRALVNALYGGEDDADLTSPINLSDKRKEKIQAAFLFRLQYDGIDDRALSISKAHETTFRWIFDDNQPQAARWSSFKGWLRSEESQLYWITGKAGAGKSTLMKFLTQPSSTPGTIRDSADNQSRCEKYLRKWAGNQPLVVATFYFWASGSAVQRSQRGLLMTLLYQILRQIPEATPFASPRRWEVLSLFNEDPKAFKDEELRDMLNRAVRYASSKCKIVLFVDGLDEFDGNLEPLISIMHDIVSNSPVKLCVASRPWVEFQKAFKDKPSLRLEDLTYSDIKSYVKANFEKDVNFTKLHQRDTATASELIEAVVSKASGVFLWVRIVVASLLSGISQGDRVRDLKKRLELLPQDLEKLYDRILDGLDSFYYQHAAEYFSLMRSCPNPPPALLFSFADENESMRKALTSQVQSISEDDIINRIDQIDLRLNSRCKGLLEIGGVAKDYYSSCPFYVGAKIQYLHRTVRDYIDSAEAKRKLDSHLSRSFDPNLQLLAGTLAMTKACNQDKRTTAQIRLDLEMAFKNGMYHAARVHPKHDRDVVRLLDRMYKVRHFRRVFDGYESYYTGHGQTVFESMSGKDRFLCLAIQFGVVPYAKAKVKKGCLIQVRREDLIYGGLLDSSILAMPKLFLRGLFSDATLVRYPLLQVPFLLAQDLSRGLRPSMFEALLSEGADPNCSFKFRTQGRGPAPTAWLRVIGAIARAFDNLDQDTEAQGDIGKIARLMIDHGANVKLSSVRDALILEVNDATSSASLWNPEKDESQVEELYQVLKEMKRDKDRIELAFDEPFDFFSRLNISKASILAQFNGSGGDLPSQISSR